MSRKLAAAADRWRLADAKAEFSRVVKLAQEQGPQRVTSRGRDAAVVISATEYDRLTGGEDRRENWRFFSESPLRDLKIRRIGGRMPVRRVKI